MKNVVLITAALLALLPLGPATGATDKTVAVSITRVGFVPRSVSIGVGDTVTWTNNDTNTHQAVSQAAGFASPVLREGQSFSHQFTRAGRFTVTDPLNRNERMTVTVAAAAATLSLSATPGAVTYGAPVTVRGALSSGETGEKVDIRAQLCGETSARVVASTTTTSGGSYSVVVHPPKKVVYTARAKSVTSSGATVGVRPKVRLVKLARGRFKVSAWAADSLVGRYVVFQRFSVAQSKWVTIKRVVLRTATAVQTPLAGTTLSQATFRAKVSVRLRVRAVLPPSQAGSCYAAASSATIRS